MINSKTIFRMIGIAKCPTCRGKFRILTYDLVDNASYISEIEDLCIEYISTNIELLDKITLVDNRIERLLDKFDIIKEKHTEDINKLHKCYKSELDSLNKEIDHYNKEFKNKNLISDNIMLANVKAIETIASMHTQNTTLQIRHESLKYKIKSLEETVTNSIRDGIITSSRLTNR